MAGADLRHSSSGGPLPHKFGSPTPLNKVSLSAACSYLAVLASQPWHSPTHCLLKHLNLLLLASAFGWGGIAHSTPTTKAARTGCAINLVALAAITRLIFTEGRFMRIQTAFVAGAARASQWF